MFQRVFVYFVLGIVGSSSKSDEDSSFLAPEHPHGAWGKGGQEGPRSCDINNLEFEEPWGGMGQPVACWTLNVDRTVRVIKCEKIQ